MKTSDHRVLVPAAILVGATLALAADLISQAPGTKIVLPLNAVTALHRGPGGDRNDPAAPSCHGVLSMADLSLLETHELTIGYARARAAPLAVVTGITAVLRPGEFVCLLGPNGAGKTTLIRTLSGMQPPLSGTVCLGGTPIGTFSARKLAQRMSLVLTQRVAVGMMRVATLVALGRHPYTDWAGRLKREDEDAVRRAIADVGIESLAHRPVSELSDGERQKALIARALAQEPEIMILDEATAYLDLPRRVELMHLLGRLAHTGNRAILLSTHDLDLALRCADRLWLLPAGGPLRSGVPEDLVLSDAFGRTFGDAEVRFDKGAGAFTLKNAFCGVVALRGSGVPGMWTYRALERAGYRVVAEGEAKVCVEVLQDNGVTAWKISHDAGRCRSLENLLGRLKRSMPPEGRGLPDDGEASS